MIAIVDYGVGNLQSLARAFASIGAPVEIASTPGQIAAAKGVVLPGVGHFQEAMDHLRLGDLLPALEQRVRVESAPLLGVCLGMQLLMQRSEEGDYAGLGWIAGEVASLRTRHPDASLKVPHIGWNTIQPEPGSILFHEVPAEATFYFAHSFAVFEVGDTVAASRTRYGVPFVSAVEQGNVFGTQFHPEKSHQNGVHVLRNFVAHVQQH